MTEFYLPHFCVELSLVLLNQDPSKVILFFENTVDPDQLLMKQPDEDPRCFPRVLTTGMLQLFSRNPLTSTFAKQW